MNEIACLASAFLTVFALGFQQQNVTGRHYRAAVATSLLIGACQIYLWRALPTAGVGEILATLAGGPLGIVAAMWAHPRLMAARRPARAGKAA